MIVNVSIKYNTPDIDIEDVREKIIVYLITGYLKRLKGIDRIDIVNPCKLEKCRSITWD